MDSGTSKHLELMRNGHFIDIWNFGLVSRTRPFCALVIVIGVSHRLATFVRSKGNHEIGIVALVTGAGSSSNVRLKNH
ncbi:Zeta-carotene desaturase, chloroplastic/chromoplastic [Gossypium arboreum]|uniref:Zeta-carotene desaturase, chloroplastic/chromoplastic n=1 Tax=Gossypium arboreum TaxID=29729 RepID=A0A0B0NCG6_GOSAR|nr:Zeta-carotene desaturase, chloroplastic/chromoplastic [Gossypium arboreum]